MKKISQNLNNRREYEECCSSRWIVTAFQNRSWFGSKPEMALWLVRFTEMVYPGINRSARQLAHKRVNIATMKGAAATLAHAVFDHTPIQGQVLAYVLERE